MDYIADRLMPLKRSLGKGNAYLGFLAALAVFFLALFLPWASIPVVVVGHGGISSDGWSEQAYISVLPFAGLFLNWLPNRKALKMNVFGLCILLAFALLLVDNVEHRTTWLTAPLVDAGQTAPHMIYGSSLDIGFWLALAAMVAMSLFGLVTTMFVPADEDSPQPAAANAAGQGA
jgi:hypothetical protein